MTLSEIRELLKDFLGSPLPAVVRDDIAATENANLLRYVNNAQGEMVSDVGGVVSTGDIVLTDGVRLYDSPAGFLAEFNARYVADTDDIKPLYKIMDLNDLPVDYETEEGEPTHYYFEGLQLAFYPIPGSHEDGNDVRVRGWYEPTALAADTDVPDWPSALHRPIAMLAAVNILEAQARAEAQAADPDIAADSVSSDTRTKEYSFRAKEIRELYTMELRRIRGPKI